MHAHRTGEWRQQYGPWALRELDAEVPVQTPTTIRELIDNNLWIARLIVALFAALSVLGLALASVGLYGVLSYAVRSRRREIGVRIALGADRRRVVRLVLMQGLKVVALGAGVGFSLSWLSAVALSTVLGDVRITDPLSFGGAILILVTVATLACYLPARRASRLDPAVVLRRM